MLVRACTQRAPHPYNYGEDVYHHTFLDLMMYMREGNMR